MSLSLIGIMKPLLVVDQIFLGWIHDVEPLIGDFGVVYGGYIGIMETTIVYWGYIGAVGLTLGHIGVIEGEWNRKWKPYVPQP